MARHLPLQARKSPHSIALRAPCGVKDGMILYRERTFAQLDGEVDACARLMSARGIVRGSRVLIMVRQGLELIVCTFALMKVGAVPVVIDPGMGLKKFLACVRRTAPDALVCIGLGALMSWLFRGSFASVRTRIVVGSAFMERLEEWRTPEPFQMADTGPEDLAAILFTSGSTGAPKGVRHLHGMLEGQLRLLGKLYRFEPGEVNMPMLPVFALFNPALGMMSVVPDLNPSKPAAADPDKLVAALLQNRVTNSFGSPVLWRKVADCCTRRQIVLPALRTIMIAGASVPLRLVETLRLVAPNAAIHTPYGATEGLPLASVDAQQLLGGAGEQQKFGHGSLLGRPAPEVQIAIMPIVEAPVELFDASLRLPAGEVGEIVACGPVVTHEYDMLPDATKAAKMRDAEGRVWHRMGDLGRIDEDGRLWFCGRKAERVQCKGGTLFTDCCEGVFNAHPDVARTALVGIRRGGEVVPALAVEPVRGRFPLTAKARRDFVEELMVLGQEVECTQAVRLFFFERHFPVDVRHNAKIHRLDLARKLEGRRGEEGQVQDAGY